MGILNLAFDPEGTPPATRPSRHAKEQIQQSENVIVLEDWRNKVNKKQR